MEFAFCIWILILAFSIIGAILISILILYVKYPANLIIGIIVHYFFYYFLEPFDKKYRLNIINWLFDYINLTLTKHQNCVILDVGGTMETRAEIIVLLLVVSAGVCELVVMLRGIRNNGSWKAWRAHCRQVKIDRATALQNHCRFWPGVLEVPKGVGHVDHPFLYYRIWNLQFQYPNWIFYFVNS